MMKYAVIFACGVFIAGAAIAGTAYYKGYRIRKGVNSE